MEHFQEYWIPWLISNVIAILILVAAIRKPKLARLLFALIFAWACWLNYTTAHNSPQEYLEYASLTPVTMYQDFIDGWFREHITAMVTFISIGQGLIALGMFLKGWLVRIAAIGAIIFFLAIAPLGIGSAFPFSIFTIIALYFILKKDDLNYLWKFH